MILNLLNSIIDDKAIYNQTINTTQLYSLMFYEKIISDFSLNFENNFTLSHNTNSPKITTNDNMFSKRK